MPRACTALPESKRQRQYRLRMETVVYRDIIGNCVGGCDYDCDVEISRRSGPNTRLRRMRLKQGNLTEITLIFSHVDTTDVELVRLQPCDLQMLHQCTSLYEVDDKFCAWSTNLIATSSSKGMKLSTSRCQTFVDKAGVERLFAAVRVKDFIDRFERMQSICSELTRPLTAMLSCAATLFVLSTCARYDVKEPDQSKYKKRILKLLNSPETGEAIREQVVRDSKRLTEKARKALGLEWSLNPHFFSRFLDSAHETDNGFISPMRFWTDEFLFVRGVWNRHFRYLFILIR